MGEDNGFVERPVRRERGNRLSERMRRLIQTSENGKAVVWPYRSLGGSGTRATLRRHGLEGHVQQEPDGTYVAWCERIEATS